MTDIGHNRPPYISLDLDEDTYQLLVDTCEANIQLGLSALGEVQAGRLTRNTGEKLIALMERYKRLLKQLQEVKSR